MQRTAALLMAFILLWQMFAMGFPAADLDASGRVDLQDAIIAARGIAELAEFENPARTGSQNLASQVRNVVAVLRTMSGNVHQMTDDSDDGPLSLPVYFALQLPGDFTPPSSCQLLLLIGSSGFESTNSSPALPPPESPFAA